LVIGVLVIGYWEGWMKYKYADEFLVGAVERETLEALEDEAIEEINLLNISNDFYFERLVKTKVYMDLCVMQLESKGMREKYETYRENFKRFIEAAKDVQPTVKVSRG